MNKFLHGKVLRTCGRDSGAGDDKLFAAGGANYLDGGNGNDILSGDSDAQWQAFAQREANDFYFENLVVLLGVEMAAGCDNGTHHMRCDVLFGREKCEAANDAEGRMRA